MSAICVLFVISRYIRHAHTLFCTFRFLLILALYNPLGGYYEDDIPAFDDQVWYGSIPCRTIPYNTIPYHTIPYPYHIILTLFLLFSYSFFVLSLFYSCYFLTLFLHFSYSFFTLFLFFLCSFLVLFLFFSYTFLTLFLLFSYTFLTLSLFYSCSFLTPG